MSRHRIFGMDIESDLVFSSCLGSPVGQPPLKILAGVGVDSVGRRDSLEPLFESPFRTLEGKCPAVLYKTDEGEVLCFPEIADFELRDQEIRVFVAPSAHRSIVELRLLGPVLSYWLERRGQPTLHASSVEHAGRALLFLSTHRGGKTSLAGTFMKAGDSLLSDDIVPIIETHAGFFAGPGYPQMRMWPDLADHFLGNHENLERVHPELEKLRVPVGQEGFGSFEDGEHPIGCLILPERRDLPSDSRVDFLEVSPKERLIELVRHSFSPHIVQAVGLQEQRLALFVRLLEGVPMWRMVYPDGLANLARVRDEIADFLGQPA